MDWFYVLDGGAPVTAALKVGPEMRTDADPGSMNRPAAAIFILIRIVLGWMTDRAPAGIRPGRMVASVPPDPRQQTRGERRENHDEFDGDAARR